MRGPPDLPNESGEIMKVIIQKPDLDTCLTALILGVSSNDEIVVSKGNAAEAELMNPKVLCIEAGNSGDVSLYNFDHHAAEQYFPPACKQAYDSTGMNDPRIERLVEYVCMVDDRIHNTPKIQFPSLSNIFSGMLIIERDFQTQFMRGVEILTKVLNEDIDPFASMPDIKEWNIYKAVKIENQLGVEEALKKAEFYKARGGLKIGFLKSGFIGGIGALYCQGCDIVIMFNPFFGEPPTERYTIAGNNRKVSHLLKHFEKLEKGWGGRETIIGSPRQGSLLSAKQVLAVVIRNA